VQVTRSYMFTMSENRAFML